jgi:hypothetical protein
MENHSLRQAFFSRKAYITDLGGLRFTLLPLQKLKLVL